MSLGSSLSVIALVALIGCADRHQLIRTSESNISLNEDKSILIITPKDGRYGEKNYTDSGATTAQIISASFAKHILQINVQENLNYKDALSFAKEKKYDYLVYPLILHWEDRATEWSSIPDKVSIKISIIEVEFQKEIDSAIIEGKSGIATFGGDHP
jgi:hypothetical protein